ARRWRRPSPIASHPRPSTRRPTASTTAAAPTANGTYAAVGTHSFEATLTTTSPGTIAQMGHQDRAEAMAADGSSGPATTGGVAAGGLDSSPDPAPEPTWTPGTLATGERVPFIDFVRAFSLLVVVAWHWVFTI